MANVLYDWDVEPEERKAVPVTRPEEPPAPGFGLRFFDRIFRYQEWRERWH